MNELPSTVAEHYVVDEEASGVLIEARSTAGKIAFGTTAVSGFLDVARYGDSFLSSPPPRAELNVDLRTLRSGNAIYDAELAQRLDVRRHPTAVITMTDMKPSGDRYQVSGEITLQGRSRLMAGSVSVEAAADGWLISGQQLFDIRDFDISVPSVMMLRIFPDVVVSLSLQLSPAPGKVRQVVG